MSTSIAVIGPDIARACGFRPVKAQVAPLRHLFWVPFANVPASIELAPDLHAEPAREGERAEEHSPTKLLDTLNASVPRYAATATTLTDTGAVARCREGFTAWLATQPPACPPPHPAYPHLDRSIFFLLHETDVAANLFCLPSDAVAAALQERYPHFEVSTLEDAWREVRRASEFERGGVEAERIEREHAARIERERREDAARAALAKQMNEKVAQSVGDAGLMAIVVDTRAPGEPSKLLDVAPSFERGPVRVYFFRFGLRVPVGDLALGVRVLPSDTVFELTRATWGGVRPITQTVADRLHYARRESFDAGPVDDRHAFDASTAEGRDRIEQARALTEEHVPALYMGGFATPPWVYEHVVNVWIRGLRVSALAFVDAFGAMMREYHAKRTAPAPQPTRRAWALGTAIPATPVVQESPPYAGFGSDEAILLDFAAKVASGERATMAPDELYVAPDPGVLDRIREALTVDPFTGPLRAAVADREWIRSEELADALRREGLIVGEPSTRDHQRIKRTMERLGYRKGEATVNGERFKAFKRGAADTAAA